VKADKTLVLGGGGLAGLGWFAGLIFGLKEGGVDLRDAERMIGTSAGSATAAQLRSPQSIETLYARQTDPELIADEPPPSSAQLAALMATYPKLMALTDNQKRLQAIRSLARTTATAASEMRRTMIERRLSGADWSDAALTVTAVDLETCDVVTFHAGSSVGLVDAVAASCAVPGIWPVVEIAGRSYMDGGVYSVDNAHLAAGSARVIILSPLGSVTPMPPGFRLADQVAALEAGGAKVLVVEPDADCRTAMGSNPFDPLIRMPTSLAARKQGNTLAGSVGAFWA
jgi:NTE family protein